MGKCSVVSAFISNEIHFDMPDMKSFCERIVIKTSEASCVMTDSFDNFTTESFEFSYHWFYKA